MYESKIIFGDCIDIMKNMENKSIDVILTDIPYDVINRQGGIRNFDKGNADILTFDLTLFLDECTRLCKGSIYIFCSTEQAGFIRSFMDKSKEWKFVRLGIWAKKNPLPAGGKHFWVNGIEVCVCAKKSNAYFNKDFSFKKPIWEFPIGSSKRHKTEKNLHLFKHIINASSKEGDIVFDPCAGSGTTAEACILLNRKYICVDNDLKNIDTMYERIKKAHK